MRWTTAAVGGFGSFTCSFPGWPSRRDLPFLGLIRVCLGERVVWEGRIEDVDVSVSESDVKTTVQGFGLRRLLADTSVSRIWVKRDYTFQNGINLALDVTAGRIDASDYTRVGLAFRCLDGYSYGTGTSRQYIYEPQGGRWVALKVTAVIGTNMNGNLFASPFSGTGASSQQLTTSGDYTLLINAPAQFCYLQAFTTGTFTGNSNTNKVEYTDIRLLGVWEQEDEAGGYYGGTILRDLISVTPGLQVGTVDLGADFLIQQIDRSARGSALSVLEEIAAYYTREWGVWEDGRLDWRTPQLDEPTWLTTLADHTDLQLAATTDTLGKTIYLGYQDAAVDSLPNEQASPSTSQRNPYVRTGAPKDVIVNPGFPLTSRSASQLAQKLAQDLGNYPPVTGRVQLHCDRTIQHATRGPQPAWLIRAGENIRIADLPADNLMTTTRDGETLFHITNADVDLEQGTVTLELEGQTRRSDVLLARLAAATRIVTG